MGCFDDIPEDLEETYPCDCGGSIKLIDGLWQCTSCNQGPEQPNEEAAE